MRDASRSAVRLDRLGLALMIGGLGLGALSRALMPEPDACPSVTAASATVIAASFVAFGLGFARCLTGRAGRYLTLAMAILTPVVIALALAAARRAADCG